MSSDYQDAQADADPYTRETLAEKARHLNDNSAIVAGVTFRVSTLVVGSGLIPEPNTGDEILDRDCEAIWEEFTPVADALGLDNFGQMQRQIFEGKLINGDGFSYLTEAEDREPRVQLIESHLVAAENRNDLLGGVILDDLGREAAYRVCTMRDSNGNPVRDGDATEIEAAYMVHHRWQRRAREYRPLSAYKAAINTAHDMQDILALEKAAVKDACEKTDVIETASGEANTAGRAMTRIALQNQGNSALNALASAAYYEKSFGPKAKYIKRGDKYTPYIPARPSPAWQGLMEYLSACICMPLGFPPSVLLQIKVGGADTRRDLATAARVIQVMQYDLACELDKIRRYVLKRKLGAKTLPTTWARAEWHGPRNITCDYGRQQQQDREDLAMGVVSLQEYCATQETTMRKLLRQNAIARKVRAEVAKEFTLTPKEVFNFEVNEPPTVEPPTANE